MGDIYYSVGGNQEQEQGNKQYTGNLNSDQYLNSLNEEERKKIMAEGQQPLTGREAALALKQDPDLVLTKQEYLSYLDYHKTEETSILEGISEGASAVLGDIVKAGGAFLDHPLTATAKLTPSLIEAFSQGTRNLYGMMAQSGDPNSVLFKMKDAIAGNGSDAGYQQFLEARKFLKESGQLASGEKTLVVDKDLIDHDVTQAMSYIADPTLFIPFGTVASAGVRAAGMGEKLTALSMRAGAIKSAVVGGGLKYAVGAPIEFMGGAVRGTLDRAAAIGGGVLETATGMPAAELKSTLRLSGVATTGASIAGHSVPIISDISNLYMAGGAARGVGEAVGLVGQQMMNQGLKRGNLSFAAQAIVDTERAGLQLSKQTKGLLKVIDTFDPLLAYGVTMGEGMAHGAVIGGGLGYLSGGEEGLGHGIGAGMALGGVGAGMGRIFADVTGGIRLSRAEVQGHFNLVTDKEFNPARYDQFSLELANAKSPAHRATILQTYGGLDVIAPKAEWHMGQVADFEAGLKAKGFDPEGYIIDPSTGQRQLDTQGNPIKGHGIGSKVFRQIEGGVIINKDGVVSIHINRDNASSTTMSHEIFHAVLKTTVMRDGFLRDWTGSLLGRFDARGVRVENGKVDASEFKQFTDRYYDDMPSLEGETKADHQQRIANMKKGLTEAHDSYIKNNGDLSKMTETERNTLLYQTEEFGAYYFEKWIAGKPLDYLFHGGKIPGIRGLIGEATDSLSDYWLRKGGKANPSFDFTRTKPDGSLMPIESTFQPSGKGSRTRNPAFDGLMSDFIKAHSANQQARALALGEWTATGRLAYMRGNGLDGLNALFDPITGIKRTVTAEQIDAENKKKGAAIADSLIKMPPADRTSVTDGDGNITGTFSDKELVVLVKEGHISQPVADRIKSVQEAISDKTKPNIFGFLYHGNTMETAVIGSSQPRLTGDAVPVTRRRVVPVGHTISFGKDGFNVIMTALDMNVIDARGNNLWADPKVRALWGDNRGDFDASFAEYISNASKAGNDTSRVPSEMLPSLAQLDGNGVERRNIMHQFLGLAKAEGVAFQNKPIAEIPRGTTSSMTSFRMDLMSPFTVDHMAQRMNFDLGNAFKDLSTNFKVSEMAKEDTPNGVMWTHESGYKLSKDTTTGKVQAYDSSGKHLGVFDSTKKAEFAAKTAYAKEQADIPNRQIRGAKIQQDFQNQFKVFHDTDRAQAFERGDVFETDTARALTDGTYVIRQTREEHYNERFLKLRQSDPETVLQATEAVVAKGEMINQKIAELEKIKSTVRGKELVAVLDEIKLLQGTNRTHDIRLAMDRAKSAFTDRISQGQALLEYIKSSRKNGVRYDEMAKTFFGESYDSQFQTGKAVSVVATHGTNSAELLASKEFNPDKFGIGGRHGSAEDSVGAFFSGEIKTSRGYALDTNKSGLELQKEYGHESVHRQVRTINRYDNPLVVDAKFQNYSPSRYRKYIADAKAGGHDGIIIQNVYDGGYADTVFVTMADKVKDNTMIIDTRLEVGVLRSDIDRNWSLSEQTEGAYGGDIQQSVPRGAMTMLDMGGSWKVGKDGAKEKPLSNSEKQALKIVRTTLPMSMPAIWDMLKKSGDIVKNFDWRQIKGAVIVSNPDTMIAGSVSMGKTPILKEVKGGSNFPIAQQGEAWAVASKAKQTEYVNSLNAAYDAKVSEVKILGKKQGWSADKLKQELADVSVHMVLTRGSDAKVLNNTQGAFGAMTLLKDFVKKGVLTEQGLRDALDKASKHTYKDKDTKVVTRTFPTLDYTGTENVKLNKLLSEKFFDSKDTSTFNTRGTFVSEVIGEIAKNNKEFKSKENLAKLREVFSNPEFKLSKEALLSEIGKSFSEPYTDNIPQHHAFASVEINGRVEGATSAHPAYPHGIRKVGGGQVKLNLFSDTVAIRDMVNHPTGGDLSKTPLAENLLGSNSKGIARAVMKSSSEHSARPEGEGRIGANYKVSDIAGESRGGKTYDQKSVNWNWSFLGHIAEAHPEKVADLSVHYMENKTTIKGQNLTTLTLHNNKGQQVGIINAAIYNDGTAKIQDTIVLDGFQGKGYNKIMLSELGERMRSLGVKEITGDVVDPLDRPTRARRSVFGNAELDPDSFSNISISGKKTVTKLDPEAHYKVSDYDAGDGPVPDVDFDALLKADKETKDRYSKSMKARQKYTEDEMSSAFVGRIAEETPRLTKGKSISYSGAGTMKTLTLTDSKSGEVLGSIHIQNKKSQESSYIHMSDIREEHQGKGYGTLLYSELAERLRHDGYTTLNGQIVDELGRPFKIREKVIDQENKRIGEQGSMIHGDKIFSPLYADAHYKVSDEQMSSAFIGRVAKENPKITKGIRVEFEKTRSSKFGDEYILRLFKKDKSDGGEEILIGTFNSEVDGNSASSGNAEIKGDFRNKGYGRLMYSEMAERLRALGAESWGGRMVDQKRRPQTLRERVIDQENARLGYQDSETKLSDERQDYNGDKTFYIESTLHKEAHYKVSDKPMLAEKQKETNPNIKPFEGNFKVSRAVLTSVSKVSDLITAEKDKSNLSPSIKSGFKAFSDAIKVQDSTDEVLVPEVRTAYDALREQVKHEIDNSASGFTPKEVLENIKTQLDKVDKHISKDAKKIAEAIRNRDMAEGADVEGRQIQSARAEGQRDLAEGADVEGEQVQRNQASHRRDMSEGAEMDREQTAQRDLIEGEEQDAAEVPRPSVRTAPAKPSVPFNLDASLLGSPANPVMPPSRLPSAPVPTGLPLPSRPTAPAPAPARPNPNATPATPTTQAQSGVPNRAWRGWVYDKSPNGSIYSNGIGWMIMVQGDKFKVYNPQRAMLGIYTDLEQAKRRVQREEPKR